MSTTTIRKAPPPSTPEPDPMAEWNARADALVAKGHARGEALAHILHADADLLARLEQPAPIEPAPVAKEQPLGLATQLIFNAAGQLRTADPKLTLPQAVAKAVDLNPELAAAAQLEETNR